MTSYLVMLQTNSNQPFIFSSPRLREQIGASFEITLLSRWVTEVAQDLVSKNRPRKNKRRTNFWVSDSSGKVIVRFTRKEGEPGNLAKNLITQVTRRALTDAPGLDVTGVFIETSSGPVDPADLERLDCDSWNAAQSPLYPHHQNSPKTIAGRCAATQGKHSTFPFSPTTTPIFRHLHRQTKTRRTPCLSPRASSARGHGQLDAFSSRRLCHVGRQMILTHGRKILRGLTKTRSSLKEHSKTYLKQLTLRARSPAFLLSGSSTSTATEWARLCVT